MVKAGSRSTTDRAAAAASEPGDAIIDCGNSLFTDTQRRFDYLKPKGIGYLGIGVSGGEEGARHGPSIMVGGSEEQWHNAEKILDRHLGEVQWRAAAAPSSAKAAPAISSRRSTTASNMATCR